MHLAVGKLYLQPGCMNRMPLSSQKGSTVVQDLTLLGESVAECLWHLDGIIGSECCAQVTENVYEQKQLQGADDQSEMCDRMYLMVIL